MRSSQRNHTEAARANRPVRSEGAMVRSAFHRICRSKRAFASPSVPILGRCIDLAFIEEGAVTTVEFKLRDWRRALQQARDHRLGADYAYVCMPKRQLTDRMQNELLRLGIGFFFFVEGGSWPFETALAAPRSQETIEVIRNELMARIAQRRRRGWRTQQALL
jgi:hypothetical protein